VQMCLVLVRCGIPPSRDTDGSTRGVDVGNGAGETREEKSLDLFSFSFFGEFL